MADRNELSAFLKLFADRHQTYVRSKNSTIWRATGQWHYLTDEDLISSLAAGSSVRRAFGSMDKTYFVVIQIDQSKSATAFQTAKNLHKQLKDIGLQPKTFYIGELELWQIFVFFAEPVNRQHAVTLTREWLEKNWFAVDSEATTVLPSDLPLQIPLQTSFTWLNDELGPVIAASEMSFQNAVSMFMQDLRANSTDFAVFQAALAGAPALSHPDLLHEIDQSIDFNPAEEIVQTVETRSIIDFSPDVPIYPDEPASESPLDSKDDSPDQFVDKVVVQAVQPECKPPVSQAVPGTKNCPSAELQPDPDSWTFDQTDQVDQAVHPEEGSDHPSYIPDQLLPPVVAQETTVDTDEPDFDQFDEVSLLTAEPRISEEDLSALMQIADDKEVSPPDTDEPGDVETTKISIALPTQSLVHEDSKPITQSQIEEKKSQSRLSSSQKALARDGPEKKTNTPKPAQKHQSNRDSFEQLTLPFGINTS